MPILPVLSPTKPHGGGSIHIPTSRLHFCHPDYSRSLASWAGGWQISDSVTVLSSRLFQTSFGFRTITFKMQSCSRRNSAEPDGCLALEGSGAPKREMEMYAKEPALATYAKGQVKDAPTEAQESLFIAIGCLGKTMALAMGAVFCLSVAMASTPPFHLAGDYILGGLFSLHAEVEGISPPRHPRVPVCKQ